MSGEWVQLVSQERSLKKKKINPVKTQEPRRGRAEAVRRTGAREWIQELESGLK